MIAVGSRQRLQGVVRAHRRDRDTDKLTDPQIVAKVNENGIDR
jgi:hypothetical protein